MWWVIHHDLGLAELKKELHWILKPFLLRRVKSEVMGELLPSKSEVILYHGLTELQKKLYKAILLKDSGKRGILNHLACDIWPHIGMILISISAK